MEEEFQSHLQRLEQEFSNEGNVMTKTHKAQRKEMKDMLAEMKTEFDEAISEKRQEFETTREELKVYSLLSPLTACEHPSFAC
jgi:arsenate reductase-like glutaredoxin family protein